MELNEKYKKILLDSIPVVKGMQVEIDNISNNSITVSAPLNANINYEGTAFGGSLNTVSILACYTLVHHILKIEGIEFDSLVIQNSEIEYIQPVEKDFFAISYISDKSKKHLFEMLERKRRGRVEVISFIRTGGRAIDQVKFKARFVVKK